MSKFKIISSIKDKNTKPFEGKAKFKVNLIKGKLNIGDSFTAYDTHHPIIYNILDIIDEDNFTILICNPGLGYEKQFEGTFINTQGKSKIEKFYYKK